MSDTVLERDARIILESIEAMRGKREWTDVYSYSRALAFPRPASREVDSYGRHFPLFRYVPRGTMGSRRELFLINGDASPRNGRGWNGSRTPDHQDTARRAIDATGADWLIVPFTALAGAGIDLDSVRLVDRRPDARWQEERTAETLAQVPLWRRTVSVRTDTGPDDAPYYARTFEQRERARGEDGLFHWKVDVHRLGDSLFSAIRPRVYERPARPLEVSRESARVTVAVPAPGESYCHAASSASDHVTDLHAAGPSGACIYCGRELTAQVTIRTRARYLSSFDTNETPALYFLAQVPRGAGDTVESALDALAPRAVHAAIARGVDVRRQGDIFFIETPLTREQLAARGATFARVTQWDRDARARKGEVGYVRPLTAQEKRAMREYARRRFGEIHRAAMTSCAVELPRPAGEDSRRRWKEIRARHARELESARASLRRIALGARESYGGRAYALYRESQVQADRRRLAARARGARTRLEQLESRGPRDSLGAPHARGARDAYRAPFFTGPAALSAWRMARTEARARFMPHEHDGSAIAARRELVRRAVSIYGTAHTASVVANVDGAVYAQGTAIHRPDLEQGRTGRPDHARVFLRDNVWYLAVRNAVPRQTPRARL